MSNFCLVFAQKSKYWVQFTDKQGTPFSLNEPEKFLSARAIQRRLRQKISIQPRDLPVNPQYVAQLQAITGVKVWYTSKWLNAAMVEAEATAIPQIQQLAFVKPDILNLTQGKPENNTNASPRELPALPQGEKIPILIETAKDYGFALAQNAMLGVEKMHQDGYRGQGMIIAVFDSGFQNVHKLACFKHLFCNNQILGTYNFVENHSNVYALGDHGTKVLSCIAAYKKGELIGTAPEASFYLFRTEDEFTEYKVEEVNWLIAAERADSAGVDVINSSLGYTTFDDASTNYTTKDLNGKTAIVSQAANIAARCGMLVVSSAGNEGDSEWQYIATPADADSIIATAATDKNGQRAFFSSKGVPNDSRIKPNLAALGSGAAVWSSLDYPTISSGTSFSSPILCGMATAFWQANPTLTNYEVIEWLQKSASQAHKPDKLLGYGIPNYSKAQNLLKRKNEPLRTGFFLYPNPLSKQDSLSVYLSKEIQGKDVQITLYNSAGAILFQTSLENAPEEYILNNFHNLQAGIYYLEIETTQSRNVERVLIKE
ncbi:MAG: S8 family serine peptidase [Microscillaceae bacterium]|nr:S8 family serine peptidase [Microscillaceae bacterium]MDW8461989.1 S8 family serine peptidase [Cytophagales bacterium]